MIEDDHAAVSTDIFITPTSDDDLSAEDSDDDDQPTNIIHLSQAQLSVETEARIHTASCKPTNERCLLLNKGIII